MLRKIAFYLGAATLVATPLAAQKMGADAVRDSAPVTGASELADQNTIFFILGIAAVAAAVVFLSEDSDTPVSA